MATFFKIAAKLVFFVIALFMFMPAKLAYIGGADQKTWIPTEAIITKSELGVNLAVKKAEILKDDKTVASFNEDTYFWDVEYKYTVNNHEFTGEGIYVSLKTSSGDKSKYKQKVKNYPVGSKITAYVSPNKNEYAYLERRTEGGIETWYNVTRVLFYLSILLFFTPLIKMFRKKEDLTVERVN